MKNSQIKIPEEGIKITALLPMKAHSERVANKNIRKFAGKPLYHHVTQVLESSKLIDCILINTDSDTIKQEAERIFSKVKIINRPSALRGDFIPMNEIIKYDIQTVDTEHFLQTHSTNPLLTRETLEMAICQYIELLHEFDSLFSVTEYKNRLYWKSGEPVNHDPLTLQRTQDMEVLYEENSNIYLFSKKSFFKSKNSRIGRKPKMFVMNRLEAMDIDDEEDWILSEMTFKYKMLSTDSAPSK